MRALTLWRTLLSLGCRPRVWFYRTGVTREADTGGFDARPPTYMANGSCAPVVPVPEVALRWLTTSQPLR